MRNWKKVLCAALCAVMVGTSFAWNAPTVGEAAVSTYSDTTIAELKSRLTTAWEAGSTDYLNLLDLQIDYDDLSTYYWYIRKQNPEYFYVSSAYSSSGSGSYAYLVLPEYEEDYNTAEKKAEFNAATQLALSGMDDSWTAVQKVLYIHDYLCENVTYDYTYKLHNAYDALVTGTCVCQGYAEAFEYLCQQSGIACTLVESTENNHAWNLVQVDGTWYYVDVTWDDGTSTYDNFLKSQEDMVTSGHSIDDSDWVNSMGENVCGLYTESYDASLWQDSVPPTVMVGSKLYSVVNDGANKTLTIVSYDFTTKETETVATFTDTWYIPSSSAYYTYSHFSYTFAYDHFFVADSQHVYSVALDGTKKTLYTLTDEENATYRIYGLSTSDTDITYALAEGVSPDKKEKTISMATAELEGYSADYSDSLNLGWWFELDGLATEGGYVVFTYADETTETVSVSDATQETKDGKTYYVFYTSVAAKDTADQINARFCWEETSLATGENSAAAYLKTLLADTTADYYSVVKSMLVYATQAQLYFEPDTEDADLAYADARSYSYTTVTESADKMNALKSASGNVTYAQTNIGSDTFTAGDSTFTYSGTSLVLLADTTQKIYFKVNGDVNDFTFKFDDTTLTPVQSGKYYYVAVEGITASHLGDLDLLTVTDGTNSGSLYFSPMNYCYKALTSTSTSASLKNVTAALYEMGVAAEAYLDKD